MRTLPEFKEIPSETGKLQELEALLTSLLPRSCQILNICKLAVQNRFPQDLLDSKFYKYVDSEEHENDRDPFIICIQKPNMCANTGVIIMSPKFITTPRMVKAFETLMNWETDIVFHSCPLDFWENHLSHLCKAHAGHTSGRSVKIDTFYLHKDDALEVDIPLSDTFELRSLAEANIPQVMENWHYSLPHSEELIKQLLKHIPSCGLFVKTAPGKEELASSLLYSTFGLQNILYTEENHRGKGYAPCVIQWLAKQGGKELGLNTVIETEESNLASRASFKRCGLKMVQLCNWYYYSPAAQEKIEL